MNSYEDLEIYQEAFNLAVSIRIHSMKLANPDKYELGSQIRRSSQSIKDNIVEGYGRKMYKPDFIRFLIIAHSSTLEAKSQAKFIEAIHPNEEWKDIIRNLDKLGIKIYKFIAYVRKHWKT